MKKIFTMKRVILIMCLVLLYSSAFMFVKIYAEKSILSGGEPSNASLYSPDKNEDEDENRPTAESLDNEEPAVSAPVEYIVNKAPAGQYPMLLANATAVSDIIEITTTTKPTAVTTVPTTTESPATTTTSEAPVTKAPETEPPESAATEQQTEDEEALDDGENEDIEEEDGEIIEEPEEDGLYIEMTPEELQELLKRLGITSMASPSETAPSNPGDVLNNGDSYKNQSLTIYDTVQKRYRTENAFDLVCEITNYEVGDSMNPETIKAQAVAIYTYAKYYEQKGECAQIGTKQNVSQTIIDCVEAIDGLAMFYDGKYIMSAFSASTGGYSAASKNVWGGDLPYLQSVKNDYDYLDTKHYGITTTYTVEELRQKIESKTDIKLSNNYGEWIRILNYNDNIYAGQLSIDGHTSAYINGRERTITGHIFRTYVLSIRSTAFTVSYANGVFTFTTYGYGHGVGLSQIGANLYAVYGGYTFDQILHHYFTGVTIR